MAMIVWILCCIGGGIASGLFPVPLKHPSVVELNAHPLVFQTYKSVLVAASGVAAALISSAAGRSYYYFSVWAIASASTWVPAGLCAIAGVPLTGVSLFVICSCGTSSLVSFLVFWLIFGDKMRARVIGGRTVYAAPLYLVGILLGIVALVLTPTLDLRRISRRCRCCGPKPLAPTAAPLLEYAQAEANEADEGADADASEALEAASRAARSADAAAARAQLLGVPFAIACGLCVSAQYGVVEYGYRVGARRCAGNGGNATSCVADLDAAFDVLGSWWATFGVGALAITALCWLLLFASRCVARCAASRGECSCMYRYISRESC